MDTVDYGNQSIFRHILLALGERLSADEADEMLKGVEDAEGMVKYEGEYTVSIDYRTLPYSPIIDYSLQISSRRLWPDPTPMIRKQWSLQSQSAHSHTSFSLFLPLDSVISRYHRISSPVPHLILYKLLKVPPLKSHSRSNENLVSHRF